jgi:hypothetical protein
VLTKPQVPYNFRSLTKEPKQAITWYYPHVFHSYPYEYPRITFEDPELSEGLYYTSGIESFISTMETSSLMGMNVAQLLVDDFTGLEMAGDKSSVKDGHPPDWEQKSSDETDAQAEL